MGQIGGEMKRTLRRQPGQISPVSSSARGVLQNAQSGGKIRSINPLIIPSITTAFNTSLAQSMAAGYTVTKYLLTKAAKRERWQQIRKNQGRVTLLYLGLKQVITLTTWPSIRRGKDKKGQRNGETGVKLKKFLLRPFPDFPDIRYNTVRRE